MNSKGCVNQETESIWRNTLNTNKNNNYDEKNISNNNDNSTGGTTMDPVCGGSAGFTTNYSTKRKLNNCINYYNYYKLAEESPKNDCDTDDTYSSIHGEETEFCKDTSDTDSCTTTEDNTIAMMEVIEYEIASTESENSLYSHDSSSGTDDQVLEAVARALYETSSSSTSDLLADDEELDGPTDPELKHADYWECVKCKNKQNNPMYRYCERCYQIRKNHFPPRPKKFLKRRKRNTLRGATVPLPFTKLTPNLREFNHQQQRKQISRCSSLNSSSRSVSSDDNLTDDNITIKTREKLDQPLKTLSSPALVSLRNTIASSVTEEVASSVTPNNGNVNTNSLKSLRNLLNTTSSSTTTINCPSITTSSNISLSSSPQSKTNNNLLIKQQHEQQRKFEQDQRQLKQQHQQQVVEDKLEKVDNDPADYSTVSEDDVDINDVNDFFQLTSTPTANDDDLLLKNDEKLSVKVLNGNRNINNNNLINNNYSNVSSNGNKKLDQHAQNKDDECARDGQLQKQQLKQCNNNFIRADDVFNLFRKHHNENSILLNSKSSSATASSSSQVSLPSSSHNYSKEEKFISALNTLTDKDFSNSNENSTKKYSLDNIEYLLLNNQSDNIINNGNATTKLIHNANNISSRNCSNRNSNSNCYKINKKRKINDDMQEDSEVLIDSKKLCTNNNNINNESTNNNNNNNIDDILQNKILNDCYDGAMKQVTTATINGVCSDKRTEVLNDVLINEKSSKSSSSSSLSLMATGKLDYLVKDSGISSSSSSSSSTSSQETLTNLLLIKKSFNSFGDGNNNSGRFGGGANCGLNGSTMSQETYCSDYETITQTSSSQQTVVDELIKHNTSIEILDEIHVDVNNGDILEKNYPSSLDDDLVYDHDEDDDDDDVVDEDEDSDGKTTKLQLLNSLSTLSTPCNSSKNNVKLNTNLLRSKSSLEYNNFHNSSKNNINKSFSDNESTVTDSLIESTSVAIRKTLPGRQMVTSRKSIGVSSIEQYIEPCIVCLSRPKDAAFIHSKFAHICCCYKCAVKVWNKRKLCPICNCRVKNVMKFYVH